MLIKRIAVSGKRQITIPIEFYKELGIDQEVECYLQNGTIVLRPVQNHSGEFAEEILADLIAEGLSGPELLARFKETSRQIRPAVKRVLDEAEAAARGRTVGVGYRDVFGPGTE